jgi:hypothetical protein
VAADHDPGRAAEEEALSEAAAQPLSQPANAGLSIGATFLSRGLAFDHQMFII